MSVVQVVQLTLAVLTVPLAVYGGIQDRKLRREKLPAVPTSSLLVSPLYWFEPQLFTEKGQRYRRRAIRAAGAMAVIWVVILLLAWTR